MRYIYGVIAFQGGKELIRMCDGIFAETNARIKPKTRKILKDRSADRPCMPWNNSGKPLSWYENIIRQEDRQAIWH